MSEAAKYTVHYFPIRGKGELIRLFFEETGTPYVDHTMPKPQWLAEKAEWVASGRTPWGQIPSITDHAVGKDLTQTTSILAYLVAKEGKLGGSTAWRAAEADSMVQFVEGDWRPAYSRAVYSSEYATVAPVYFQGKGRQLADKAEAWLAARNESADASVTVVGGGEFTYADLVLFEMLDIHALVDSKVFEGRPYCKALHAATLARPNIAAYVASGRRTSQVNNSGKGEERLC